MQNPVKLSVLDQSPVKSGLDAYRLLAKHWSCALRQSRLSPVLGAEHHASDALAGCSPEVLLGVWVLRLKTSDLVLAALCCPTQPL